MKKTITKYALAASLAFSASASVSAQEIPVIGGLMDGGIPVIGSFTNGGIPVVGDLLGAGGIPVVGDLLGAGGIPVVGDLLGAGGGLPGLDGLPIGDLPYGGLSGILAMFTDTENLTRIFSGLTTLGISSLTQPQSVLSPVIGLGTSAAFNFVPIIEVLATDPASLADYLTGGGSIISNSIALVPSIPLLTVPL